MTFENCRLTTTTKYNLRIRLWSFDKSEYGQVDYEEITVASAAEDYELFLYGYSSDYSWRALVTIIIIKAVEGLGTL